MIINPGYNMVYALKNLWKEGFQENDEYIDFFFSKRFKPENTFAYIESGLPVSMASVLDASIYYKGAFLPTGYIYGVTTLSQFRGKGFSSAIIEHIKKIYPTAFLVPAAKDLFGFYEKRGFRPVFSLTEYKLHAADLDIPSINLKRDEVFPDEYKNIRDSHFLKNGYICWDTEAIAYALEENSFLGGYALKVNMNDKKKTNGIILYRKQGDQLFVSETTLPLPILHDTVSILMKQHKVYICCVRLESDKTGQAFGLLHSDIAVKNGYCNLVLD